ncbi:copper resistance D family protein [Frankia tisae]|uniref:copper resistance D family protein n=1 Tax=Frankia tisae TaxID=2950104 RepID=UPI0021BEE167|nr:CopD family protein [Frankia tisae]
MFVAGSLPHTAPISAAAVPSTPLGPFEDSAIAWTTWATLMGFAGLVALALMLGPPARRIGPGTLAATTARLARAAALLGALAVPAALTDLAHDASEGGGFGYGQAWNSLYDGSNTGRLYGLEVTLSLAGAALIAPLGLRAVASGRARRWLLGGGLAAGVVALGTTKFPDEVPDEWGRTSIETAAWMLHLLGGSVWLGGLAGLLLLALPGAIAQPDRGSFWYPAIRRFSAAAMTCVAAIALSGLFLYWEHVDGPTQLFTTMYGRVLGVKILIFGTLLLLGSVNQFWLHPRIDALRAAGDDRPLRTILTRRFPALVAVEVLLGLTVLMVAPFLHGSARNQAFQAHLARHATTATTTLPKIPMKQVSASTWIYGSIETVAVVVIMIAGYQASGRIARRRAASATAPAGDTGAVLPAG